jgi:hypothetical protein
MGYLKRHPMGMWFYIFNIRWTRSIILLNKTHYGSLI